MKVIAYSTDDPDIPERLRAVAFIYAPVPVKGKMVNDLLPVRFSAPTVEAARERAQKSWDEDVAKAAGKKPRGRPPKTFSSPTTVPDAPGGQDEFDVI